MVGEYNPPDWFLTAEKLFRSDFKDEADFRAKFPDKLSLYQELSSRIIRDAVNVSVCSTLPWPLLKRMPGDPKDYSSYTQPYGDQVIEGGTYSLMCESYFADAANGNSKRLDELITRYEQFD